MVKDTLQSENLTEEEFLQGYHPEEYKSPSVTTDILIFTMNNEHRLELLLIQRGAHPFRGKWAIPGGFVDIQESLEEAAARELKEETNLENIYLEQLYTFGAVNRDVRKRVISVAYIALVPANQLEFLAGDDAAEAELFEITQRQDGFTLYSQKKKITLTEKELAFDHEEIIRKALERLKGKVTYSDIALELLQDKKKFSIYELQLIYEALSGEKADVANFRRSFKKKFVDTGRVEKLEEKCTEFSKKPSSYYQLCERPDSCDNGISYIV